LVNSPIDNFLSSLMIRGSIHKKQRSPENSIHTLMMVLRIVITISIKKYRPFTTQILLILFSSWNQKKVCVFSPSEKYRWWKNWTQNDKCLSSMRAATSRSVFYVLVHISMVTLERYRNK
jgi:hypothetical protein